MCVSTAIYGILCRLLLTRITKAMTRGLLNIQHFVLSAHNTTTLAAALTLINPGLDKTAGYLALLDVAKAFPSAPYTTITDLTCEAGAPEPIVRMLIGIYRHTPATLHLHGRHLIIHPKLSMKDGCPLPPTLFLLYHDVLLCETLTQHPKAHMYVFVNETRCGTRTKWNCSTH